jgi:hypothetical protein
MALSDHPNPTAAWAAAARALMQLDEPARGTMVTLTHEAYRVLSEVASVTALIDTYRERGADEELWERAKEVAPAIEPARACRVARDAAYYRRYRELLDGRATRRAVQNQE